MTTLDNDSTTACSNEQFPRCDYVTTHNLVVKVEHYHMPLCKCATCTFKQTTWYWFSGNLDACVNEALPLLIQNSSRRETREICLVK